jgi:protein TonB
MAPCCFLGVSLFEIAVMIAAASQSQPVPPITVRQISPAYPPVIAPPPPPPPFAGQYARPRPNIVSLFTSDDYPVAAMEAREQGMVLTRIVVAEDGRVSACLIQESSGSKSLDSATCQIIQRRARFIPAKDENGKPIISTYGQRIRWELDALPFAPIDRTSRITATPGAIGNCMGGSDCDDSDYDPLSVWRTLARTIRPGVDELVINRRFDPIEAEGRAPLPVLDRRTQSVFVGQARVEVGYNGKVLKCSPVGDNATQSTRLCDLASQWLFALGPDKGAVREGIWTVTLGERPAR